MLYQNFHTQLSPSEAILKDCPIFIYEDKILILEYLKRGKVLAYYMGWARSKHPKTKGKYMPDCDTTLTDGTWIYHGDVIVYLEWHDVPLDINFIAHIRAQNYTMPTISKEEFDKVGIFFLNPKH
jgi:hypothetical protein